MTTITIHPAWVRTWGHATANVLGSMLQARESADADGWFTATYTHFDRTLHIRPETLLAARAKLTDAGVLETAKTGQHNRYRLDTDRLRQIEQKA